MSIVVPQDQAIAETRLLRMIVFMLGIMGVVYFGVSLPAIVEQAPFLVPWWTPVGVALVFAAPSVIGALCRWLRRDTLRLLLGGYAVGYTLAVMTFVPAIAAGPLPVNQTPWVLGVTALGTVPAALAWRPVVAWAFFALNVALMGPIRDLSNGHGNPTIAMQDAVYAPAFTAIFTALAIMSMSSARAVDRAAASARQVAARASSADARLRERARLDALVHDEVMATLYYATAGTPELDAAVARQARRALDQLRAIDGEVDAPVTVEEFVSRLRSATVAQSTVVSFEVAGRRTGSLPAEVVSAFAEAAAEAVRNSLAYASMDADPLAVRVRLSLTQNSTVATITDDGIGFNRRAVLPHRLGIRVSIEGRLAIVPGCQATVESRPRHGTVVTLRWTA